MRWIEKRAEGLNVRVKKWGTQPGGQDAERVVNAVKRE